LKNIILIGMPAAGKSTVGVILAKLLGYDFIDSDILMALEQNRPLSQIIAEDGYDSFILTEGRIGEKIRCSRTVVATGGSMIFSERAMRNLAVNGLVVWLDVPAEELEHRLIGTMEDRGVATPVKMDFREILEMREPLYLKYADIRVECKGTTEQVAADLRDKLIKEKLLSS